MMKIMSKFIDSVDDKCLKKETSIVVESLSRIRLFAMPWTAAHQVPCPSLPPGACSTHVH